MTKYELDKLKTSQCRIHGVFTFCDTMIGLAYKETKRWIHFNDGTYLCLYSGINFPGIPKQEELENFEFMDIPNPTIEIKAVIEKRPYADCFYR